MDDFVNLFIRSISESRWLSLDEVNFDLQMIADEQAELRAEVQEDILFLENFERYES